MERIEVKGEWWLPDVPRNRMSGTLVIEESSIELALFGALEQPETVLPGGLTLSGQTRTFPRIHGKSESRILTLDNCVQTFRSLGGLTTQTVSVNQVFEGIWFDLGEPAAFTQIVVRMAGLNEFVQRSGLGGMGRVVESNGNIRLSLSALTMSKDEFPGLEGAECSLDHILKSGATVFRERHITEDFAFRVKHPDLKPFESLLKEASFLRDLVSIATGRRAAFSTVSFRHPQVAHQLSDDDRRPIPIEMYANWTVQPEPDRAPVAVHQVLFSLGDLGGVDALARWLTAVQPHAASLSRVMVSRYSNVTYITDNLMNAVAALEGYDRVKYGDGLHLVKRLKRSATYAGPQFADLVGDVEAFAGLLKDERNKVAHHGSGIEGTTVHVVVSQAAVWLLILCLLRDAGAPELVFDNIAKHTSWRWLKDQVREALTSTGNSTGP